MDEGDKDLWMESIPRLRCLPRNSAGVEVHVFRKLDIWNHQITRMCPLGIVITDLLADFFEHFSYIT